MGEKNVATLETSIKAIMDEDTHKATMGLRDFIRLSKDTFSFPTLNVDNKRKLLWDALWTLASKTADIHILTDCFAAIRILSRDKVSLGEMVTNQWLELIQLHSGLDSCQSVFMPFDEDVAKEAQKSLCNIVFNSHKVAVTCCTNGVLDKIMNRLDKFKENSFPDSIKLFDMKLLFLLTALCPEIRPKVSRDYDGLVRLTKSLEFMLTTGAADSTLSQAAAPKVHLSASQVEVACEMLKALFNLTVRIEEGDDDEQVQCGKLVNVLRMYLLVQTDGKTSTSALRSDVINLLTNMPSDSYKNLVTPIEPDHAISTELQFGGQNMPAFYEIMQFLKEKLTVEPPVGKQLEVLSPTVSLLLKCANNDRLVRKYLRIHILPPLTDVHSRPEEGTTLRNCLCRLLTTPITQLRDLVAELLFVLCKKNVNRMIKYTGYGNAAGLFAQRGLLGGKADVGQADYSSDSQESETEEYAEYKHGINPVIGCYEAPHPSAMENMTEEQKEHEAMKLVELMDSLTKCGAIKPCRVGADGRPHPIEHVLQLQEGLQNLQIHGHIESDSEE